MDYTHRYASPLGAITLSSDGEALTGLWFEGQRFFACGLDVPHAEKALPEFDIAEAWLDIYFSGRAPDFTPPVRPRGTPYSMAVWEMLLTIPYGQTATYGEIAGQLTKQAGAARPCARAVGGAVGRNPISIIIPCHRVLGTGGKMTGYSGGIERKQKLLELEHIIAI